MSDFDEDLAHLHRALAEHVRREQPLSRALSIVAEECEDKRLRKAVSRIRLALDEGQSVGDAWMQGAPDVPAFYGALVEAAAQSGDLATALDQIAEHSNRSSSVTQKLRQALFGPVVTAIACLVFGGVAVFFAGPPLLRLTELAAGSTPLLFVSIGVGVLVCLVVTACLLTRARSPMAKGRYGLPLIGPLRLQAVRADVASTLALLLRRGVSLPRAFQLVAQATPAGAARDAVLRMRERAKLGDGLHAALETGDLYDGSTLWLVDAADGSDDVVHALDDLADVYGRRVQRGVERMGVVARPVAEVAIGIAVFLFAYSYLRPVLDLVDRVLWW